MRHRGKIEATINNARRALAVQEEFGSLSAYFWRFEVDVRARLENRGARLQKIEHTL